MNPDPLPPPLNAGSVPKPAVSPLVLSALVYPGAGQLMQRRWRAGSVIGMSFTAVFAWFVINVIAVLKAYYAFAFEFKTATGEAPGMGRILLPFVCSLLIYGVGVVDTAVASLRIRRAPGRPIS